jgi:hypothetical protein
MNRLPWLAFPLVLLAGCQLVRPARGPAPAPAAPAAGEYDNHEQVWTAHEAASAVPPPHVVVIVTGTARDDWSIWQIHLDTAPPVDASWAIRRAVAENGQATLLPHRAIVAVPATGRAFDPAQWAALDACALRGASPRQVVADAAACAALTPGIGAAAALLPLAIDRDGEWLHLRLYADQARGTEAREDLRQVQFFEGWAAINGAGPTAAADSRDWHMNRTLRLGNEGGRAALAWRDGKPSGYSLGLERLTYREGNVPVLKLSVIEDASGRTLAYAWANPEATRIGINLGWIQVGLARAALAPAPAR